MAEDHFTGLSCKVSYKSKTKNPCNGMHHREKPDAVFAVTVAQVYFGKLTKILRTSMSVLVLDAHIFVDHCPSYMSVDNSAPHLTEAEVLANPLKDRVETGHEQP